MKKGGKEMTQEEIFKLVIAKTCEVIPDLEGHNFVPSDRLADLGANSVDRAEIVMMAMEELNLKIPRVELFGVKNIGELADLLYEKTKTA